MLEELGSYAPGFLVPRSETKQGVRAFFFTTTMKELLVFTSSSARVKGQVQQTALTAVGQH